MYCNICGKKIPEGKELCEECEEKRKKYIESNPDGVKLPKDYLEKKEKEKEKAENLKNNEVSNNINKEKEKLEKRNDLKTIYISIIIYVISIIAVFLVSNFSDKLNDLLENLLLNIFSISSLITTCIIAYKIVKIEFKSFNKKLVFMGMAIYFLIMAIGAFYFIQICNSWPSTLG